ncbi:hypothetical protein OH76DRAFT_1241295 [Lentinus brumalis]|uniref:F-box domain-containing protein n=1 Tax=Lentinus brumalis TaxID=2498619 RepID=A0A371CS58_9APHY|nr:hypothetical protein OH76DRAFT_1241295 [Polyporus brumalis]
MSSAMLVASTVRGLPGELVDQIINFLYDDMNSLKACALVTKSWTPSSHYHLFSTVLCYPDTPGRTVEEVLAWASSEGTRAALYVTTLVVQPRSLCHHPYYSFCMVDFGLLIMRMPNVRRVTFREVVIHSHISPTSTTIRHRTTHPMPSPTCSKFFRKLIS